MNELSELTFCEFYLLHRQQGLDKGAALAEAVDEIAFMTKESKKICKNADGNLKPHHSESRLCHLYRLFRQQGVAKDKAMGKALEEFNFLTDKRLRFAEAQEGSSLVGLEPKE